VKKRDEILNLKQPHFFINLTHDLPKSFLHSFSGSNLTIEHIFR